MNIGYSRVQLPQGMTVAEVHEKLVAKIHTPTLAFESPQYSEPVFEGKLEWGELWLQRVSPRARSRSGSILVGEFIEAGERREILLRIRARFLDIVSLLVWPLLLVGSVFSVLSGSERDSNPELAICLFGVGLIVNYALFFYQLRRARQFLESSVA